MSINNRLASLRQYLISKNVDAFIVPSSDPHQSEYVADRWKAREWISGFTGSMGYAVVTQKVAQVWTDSRYFIQCEQELKGTDFKLHKQVVQGAPEHIEWLCENLQSGSRVGIDSANFSVDAVLQMQMAFAKNKIDLATNIDPFDAIWNGRPALPYNVIFEHEVKYSGKSRTQKLKEIREKMKAKNADYHLVTTLDDIGWTLNLRGSDVECNPVFIAFMVIGMDKTWLFVNPTQVPDDIKKTLNNDNIFIKSYDTIADFLNQLTNKEQIIVDTANTNFQLFNAIKKAKVIESPTFSIHMKAIKNEVEQNYIRQVMVKDGVALVKAFRYIEQTLEKRAMTEYEVSTILAQYRSDQPHYFGESFSAIVGFNANGALNHYKPDPEKSAKIKGKGILLIDSGGQYADGTTDITRTIALGEPTAEQKQNYTLVLKGHIALARLKFPAGTRGIQMDVFTRQFLWSQGLNFGHGTGHGVGFFMNVHEPPQGFAAGLGPRGTIPHEPGMYSSNEPGFYKEGSYGIRIENLVIVQKDVKTVYGQFYKLETVTLFPIDTNLVEKKWMSKEEIKWLNDYHKETYSKLSIQLNKDEKAWLKAKCKAI